MAFSDPWPFTQIFYQHWQQDDKSFYWSTQKDCTSNELGVYYFILKGIPLLSSRCSELLLGVGISKWKLFLMAADRYLHLFRVRYSATRYTVPGHVLFHRTMQLYFFATYKSISLYLLLCSKISVCTWSPVSVSHTRNKHWKHVTEYSSQIMNITL